LIATFIAVVLLSVVLCAAYRALARRFNIVDVPNERSAHNRLVPRGGGIGLIGAFGFGCVWLMTTSSLPSETVVVIGLTFLLLLVGAIDDQRNLSVATRLICYTICSAVAVYYLLPEAPMAWLAPAVIYLLWSLNLYNFMDGIDGIASLQAIFVCLAGALLGSLWGADWALVQMCLVLGAACLGFLVFNWPQASLFLGDAGSVPLGFLLAAMSLAFASSGGIEWLTCWLILLGVFIVDASTTLCWRILKGQPFLQAHNLHGYQRLSRHWKSHTRVLVLLMAINLFWLLPLAYLAMLSPEYSVIWLICAYFPLVAGVLKTYKLP
jgi:Fuc2NAc and GlcNAc transferase